jgi:hypothetical protein
MKINKYNEEQLREAIKNNISVAGVCRELKIRPSGGNYKTLNFLFKELNVDISHFTGQGWNNGDNYKHFGKKYKLEEILIENSPYKNSTKLKHRLIIEGLKEEKCESCLLTLWQYKKIPTELHHENGNNTDNRIENLKILCPNCHAQEDNYRGKNTLSFKSEMRKENFENKDNVLKNKQAKTTKIKTPKSPKEKNKCKQCGKDCKRIGSLYCSIACVGDARKEQSKIPKVPEILKAFEEFKNFVQVGKHFGVSDNAVRKWCKNYGILEMVKN